MRDGRGALVGAIAIALSAHIENAQGCVQIRIPSSTISNHDATKDLADLASIYTARA
ncbi:hypothetical protein GCM10007857_83820 [Bradyrhizobium iriomotense]|uniref:Uncharacterized protein n=1 Tax=Bradyrhizobium iriomotense TaxID=441950 RepID=A0ABQ6BB56_9BRAD|nr:hypothetical protein GCM10007857_83820 [Bradyrhizobium iriomotense]